MFRYLLLPCPVTAAGLALIGSGLPIVLGETEAGREFMLLLQSLVVFIMAVVLILLWLNVRGRQEWAAALREGIIVQRDSTKAIKELVESNKSTMVSIDRAVGELLSSVNKQSRDSLAGHKEIEGAIQHALERLELKQDLVIAQTKPNTPQS